MTEQNGLERSSATERISAMLDERGKEHRVWPSGLVIWHDEGSWVYEYSPPKGDDDYWGGILHATLRHCTPEQAVEATLGKGECDAEVEVVEFSQMQEIHRFTCSECGESFGAEEHNGLFGLVLNKVKLPNYCPNCGRRVVDA